MSDDALSKCWDLLNNAIQMIDQQRAYELSYQELYRNGYYIVQNKKGDFLYKNVSATISQIIQKIYMKLLDTQDDYLLSQIGLQWEKHKRTMSMIKDILMYMNHNYCPKVGKPLINDHGYDLFLKQLLMREPIISRLPSSLLDMYSIARTSPANADFTALANGFKMLLQLDIFGGKKEVYQRLFEREFLATSKQLFHAECNDYITTHSISEYAIFVEKRLKDELFLCNQLLYSGTYQKLKNIYLEQAIQRHASTLIKRESIGQNSFISPNQSGQDKKVEQQSAASPPLQQQQLKYDDGGFITFLNNNKMQEIRRIYSLFNQAQKPCIDLLQNAMVQTITKKGDNIMDNQKLEAHQFTTSLFDLDQKYNDIVNHACNNDSNFRLAKKKAFQNFLNKSDKTARSLAKYIDYLFRRLARTMIDQEIENKIHSTIQIFSNLSDKDIFQGFYRRALSKRLIMNRGCNFDGQKIMISCLKSECGPIFTKKMEVMLADLKSSDQFSKEFRQSRISKQFDVDFSVRVLTVGNWPFDNQKSEVVIPKPITQMIDVYTQFYLHKFAGRSLNWKLTEGTADIRMLVNNQTKHQLTVSTMQMCVLLMFNDKQAFVAGEMAAVMNVTMHDLSAYIHPLLHLKILLKQDAPTGGSGSTIAVGGPIAQDKGSFKEFKENMVIKLNPNFSNRQYKIRVPGFMPKEDIQSSKREAVQSVMEDRGQFMDSVIVRIMKSRKQMHHNDLMSEVIKMLSTKFQPDPSSIKKRIEALIDRDFIERDSKDLRLYNYLA